ncbi:hypothetical protein BDP27DRAFT_1361074 [Rhodocollybia butyracea]|uniref:Uncharacterized protein n=1 Tax=Rhodocollybia butyracea TaxID=206335 RepID=A0A9P5PU96_9AGAR|nr:hypothetical protein BDP27DRAFT_1361074 [Rhodocollybia butyracea]
MPFQAPHNLYNNYPTYDCALLSEFQPGSDFTKGLAGILHTKHYQHILDAISCQDPDYSGHLHTFAVVMGKANVLNFGALKVAVITLAKVHGKEGELFKPLLDMYDAMDNKESESREEINGRRGRDEGGGGKEGASNRASPAEYFLSHIKQVCARIEKVALDELVSENDKLAALKSLLHVLEGAGLDN